MSAHTEIMIQEARIKAEMSGLTGRAIDLFVTARLADEIDLLEEKLYAPPEMPDFPAFDRREK